MPGLIVNFEKITAILNELAGVVVTFTFYLFH